MFTMYGWQIGWNWSRQGKTLEGNIECRFTLTFEAFCVEQLSSIKWILSTCSKYEGSRLVDLSNRFCLLFWDLLVLTFSNGGHNDVMSGYAISLSLPLMVILPPMSSLSKRANMSSISCQTDTSYDDWLDDKSEKLSLVHITCTSFSDMTPKTYLASSHAHGKPWVYLRTQPHFFLSKPITFTLSNSSTICSNAYLLTIPTKPLNNELLKCG